MCGVYDMFLSRRTDTEVVFSGKVFFIIIEKLYTLLYEGKKRLQRLENIE